jgi:rod shape-determining protein MreD
VIVARVAMMTLIAVAAMLVQTVVLPGFDVFGWRPDLVMLTVVAFGLADGPETGARYGFGAGLLLDLVSGTGRMLGLSSLVLLIAGWVTGQTRPYLSASPTGGQIAVAGLASGAALLLRGLLAMLLDVGHYPPVVLLQGVLAVGLYNAALAPAVCGPLAVLSERFGADPLADRTA